VYQDFTPIRNTAHSLHVQTNTNDTLLPSR
jgi:hypothetical protein